jgi:hypothetical protein
MFQIGFFMAFYLFLYEDLIGNNDKIIFPIAISITISIVIFNLFIIKYLKYEKKNMTLF